MGQYLQMGICHRLVVDKDSVCKLNLSVNQLVEEVGKEMDISLYHVQETDNEVVFVLRESVVMQQLYEFLQFQYSLYVQEEPYVADFEAVLSKIQQASSFKEILDLAKEKAHPSFQNDVIHHKIKVAHWYWLRVDVSMFVLFVEGKIFMECYSNFLRYLENTVKVSAKQREIAGAFRCFIE